MGRIESHPPGSFCWAALATSDAGQAKQFYTQMFGWSVTESPTAEGAYYIFQDAGNDAAAMFLQPDVPTHWSVYFMVASAGDSAAKVKVLGGQVKAGPFDAGESGRTVACQDPQGVMFRLWQANKDKGMTHGGPLNNIGWVELATPDPAGAVAFYTGLFGWTTKPADIAAAPYIEWVNSGKHIGGCMSARGAPPRWMIYITVADCDERTAKATSLGGHVCMPPMDIPNVGRFSVVSDPQGATFAMIQMAVHGATG